MRQKRLLGVARIGGKHVTREELQSAIQDFWDETFNHSVHPEISAESKMIAFQCMIDAAKQELPLTLEDLRGMDGEWVWAISSDPDLTVSAWAYIVASQAHTLWEYKPDRLLGNVQLDFENYGKTWLAYRSKPKEENT